jgi:hypothetical protein
MQTQVEVAEAPVVLVVMQVQHVVHKEEMVVLGELVFNYPHHLEIQHQR